MSRGASRNSVDLNGSRLRTFKSGDVILKSKSGIVETRTKRRRQSRDRHRVGGNVTSDTEVYIPSK